MQVYNLIRTDKSELEFVGELLATTGKRIHTDHAGNFDRNLSHCFSVYITEDNKFVAYDEFYAEYYSWSNAFEAETFDTLENAMIWIREKDSQGISHLLKL